MYLDQEISELKQDENLAISYMNNPDTSLILKISAVASWESCARMVHMSDSADFTLRTTAVKYWLSCAKDVLEAHQEYFFLACTVHHELAKQLITHKDPAVRASCANWHDLAHLLKNDEFSIVRSTCAQWPDIAEELGECD